MIQRTGDHADELLADTVIGIFTLWWPILQDGRLFYLRRNPLYLRLTKSSSVSKFLDIATNEQQNQNPSNGLDHLKHIIGGDVYANLTDITNTTRDCARIHDR